MAFLIAVIADLAAFTAYLGLILVVWLGHLLPVDRQCRIAIAGMLPRSNGSAADALSLLWAAVCIRIVVEELVAVQPSTFP